MGVTTPLYTFVLASLSWLSGSGQFDVLALVVAILFFHLAMLAMIYLFRHHDLPPGLSVLLALVLLTSVSLLSSTFTGRETTLFVCLVFTHLLLLKRRQFTWVALVGVLAAMTRPEGFFLAVTAILVICISHREKLLRFCVLSALFALPWLLFATLYFDSPLPNSMKARHAAYPPVENQLLYLANGIGNNLWGKPLASTLGGKSLNAVTFKDVFSLHSESVLVLGFGLVLLGGILCLIMKRKGDIVAFPLLMALFYTVTKPLLFNWYYVPIYPFCILFVLSPLWLVARTKPMKWAGLVLLAAMLTNNVAATLRARPDEQARDHSLSREIAALWLGEHRPDLPPVLIGSIGVFGYFYPGPIRDACGIISPELIPFLPVRSHDYAGCLDTIPSKTIRATQPEIIVANASCFPRSLAASADFLRRHDVIHMEKASQKKDNLLVIEKKRPSEPAMTL